MTRCVAYVGSAVDVFEITQGADGWVSRRLGVDVGGDFMEGVRAVLVDVNDPQRIYVGTNTKGVLRSTDGGVSWHRANEGLVYQNVWSLAQHPATGEIYLGSEPAGVFRSTDGGDTWEDCASLRRLPETKEWFFPMPPHVAHVRQIGLNPDDPDDIFCAVEDGWLVRSRDRGKTWKQIRDGVHCDAHGVTFVPGDGSTVVVATGHYAYRSDDGGETFAKSSDGLERPYMAGVVVHPDRPEVLITVAAHEPPKWFAPGVGGETVLYRSEDAGRTWKPVESGLDDDERWGTWALAGDPSNPDVAFVGLFDGRVFATTDGGQTFGEIVDIQEAIFTMVCAVRD